MKPIPAPPETQAGAPSAGHLMDIDAALARIREQIVPISGRETLLLQDAFGRTLAADVRAPLNVPAFRNSAVDGYAFRHDDLRAGQPLRVVGESFAGRPYLGKTPPGGCVRIMTGAGVPDGCDTVVMQEDVSPADGHVEVMRTPVVGENVRLPGEDILQGATVLAAGRRLGAADLGLLASIGVLTVEVVRKLRVVYLSTGDELAGPMSPLTPGRIYDSNRYTLRALLQRPDIEAFDLGIIPDEKPAIENAFAQAARLGDLVITSGGVSVGAADFVKPTLQAMGQIGFWKLAIKPGKPLAFGKLGEAVFFGLPGNPVSAMVTYLLCVHPALHWMSGAEPPQLPRLRARTLVNLSKQAGRQDYQRGIFSTNAEGELEVRTTGIQGSHVLSSMSQANCLIVLPRDWGDVAAGTQVEIIPLQLFG